MAPAPLYKGQAGKPAGRRAATGPNPIVPAIPLPLQARRQQSTTALGSPIPRHLSDTPAQTPRNGTPDPSPDNSNGILAQVPPTPASITDSAIETIARDESTTTPAATITATASDVIANGDNSAHGQTTPQHDSPASRPASRPASPSGSTETGSSEQTQKTPPTTHYQGHPLISPGHPQFSPPYVYGGNNKMVRVMLGFGRHRDRGFAIDVVPGVTIVSSLAPLASTMQGGPAPNFAQEVRRVTEDACIGIFEGPHSIFPPQHPILLGAIEDASSMLVEHARNSFMKYETADCVINFNLSASTGDQIGQPDLHLPGHRFVLALSPTLQGCLAQRPGMQMPSTGLRLDAPSFAMPTWSITLADPNLTPEALLRALQVLYGFSILEPTGGPLPQAMELVVAGFHLQLPKVMWAGVDICMHTLTWKNVEQVMSFGLTGATGLNCPIDRDMPPFPLPFTRFEYSFEGGDHIRRLLLEVVAFMAIKFPAEFRLDRTAYESQIRRIPDYPTALADLGLDTAMDATSDSPTVSGRSARGHQASSSMASHDPRLSAIQFGDLSLQDDDEVDGRKHVNGNAMNGTNMGPNQAAEESPRSLLSRLLINLPFDLLKNLLEHPQLCQDSGGIAVQDRAVLMEAVLAERERRRHAARNAVLGCRIPSWDMVLVRLSQSEPPFAQPGDESWDALGWRECYVSPRDTYTRACRTWQPLIA